DALPVSAALRSIGEHLRREVPVDHPRLIGLPFQHSCLPFRMLSPDSEIIQKPMLSYDELVIRRRKLPHWRSGAKTYHVSFRSKLILPPASRQLAVDAIRKGEEEHFNLFLGVVMPDHV